MTRELQKRIPCWWTMVTMVTTGTQHSDMLFTIIHGSNMEAQPAPRVLMGPLIHSEDVR